MATVVKPAGDLTSGVQVKGATKQYGVSGTGDATSNLETITPYDSGNILGTVPPGQPGLKLVSGVVQRSQAALLCDGKINAALSTSGTGLVPTVNTAQDPAQGLSMSPQTE